MISNVEDIKMTQKLQGGGMKKTLKETFNMVEE